MYVLSIVPESMLTAQALVQRNLTILFYALLLPFAITNFVRSVQIAFQQRRIANIFCLLQTFFYLIEHLHMLSRFIEPVTGGCTATMLIERCAFVLSMTCIHAILLLKAYICSNGAWYLLVAAAITESIFIIYFVSSMAHITVNEFDWGGCDVSPTIYDMILRAGISTLPNAFLSLYFLWFAYQHCRRKHKQGSPTLNNLFVDGIFYLLGVTLADIAICILVVIGLTLGRSWTVLFSINWMIASTLIVEQLRWAKDNSRQPSRLLLPQWLK